MTNNNQFSFVIDKKGNKLSPCKINKAWYLIRKGKTIQVNKYPMVIQ
ncbi:RRXRR domain-containing protein [Clostridium sp.]